MAVGVGTFVEESLERATLPDCRPKLDRYLATWLPAWRNRSLFRDVECFLLFVGYPRSGHSLVGSLLNAHRNILVGHELNIMHYVKRWFTRNQLYWMLYKQDQAFGQVGRQWTGYDYTVPGQWQGRNESIRVIGDKHGQGATTVISQDPEALPRLRATVGVPVKMLHVVRHPLDNIATMARKSDLSLEAAARLYFKLCDTNQQLLDDRANDMLTVYFEDLIASPRKELLKIVHFLDMPGHIPYLNDCASIVFPEPHLTRNTVDWDDELLESIGDRSRFFPFLERYGLSQPAMGRAPILRRRAA